MKKTIITAIVIITATFAHAQKDNTKTFGGFGFGIAVLQSDLKRSYKTGFQANAEINGKLFKPVWLYMQINYESFSPDNLTDAVPAGNIATLAGELGLKVFPVKFLYFNAGGGIRGVISGTVNNGDNPSVYFNFGGGFFVTKFLNLFVNYTAWQAQQTPRPSSKYVLAGAKISFGRKGK